MKEAVRAFLRSVHADRWEIWAFYAVAHVGFYVGAGCRNTVVAGPGAAVVTVAAYFSWLWWNSIERGDAS